MNNCPDMSGPNVASSVMCRKNEAPSGFPNDIPKKPTKEYRNQVIGIVKSRSPQYKTLASDSNIEECALKCIGEGHKAGSPGCCEFRAQGGECAWTSEPSYLAPEVRDIGGVNSSRTKSTKAVLCSKGKLIGYNNIYVYTILAT